MIHLLDINTNPAICISRILYGNPRQGVKEQHSPGPDSIINSNDRTYLGKTIPGYTYGLSIGAACTKDLISVFYSRVSAMCKEYNGTESRS